MKKNVARRGGVCVGGGLGRGDKTKENRQKSGRKESGNERDKTAEPSR